MQLLPGATIGWGPLTINGGAFNNGGNNLTVESLSGSGGIIVLNGGSVDGQQHQQRDAGGIPVGSGAFIKQGGGTLTLAGNNSYGGGTTVSGGILAGNELEPAGQHRQQRDGGVQPGGAGIYAGAMAGSGSVTMQGGGMLNLTGATPTPATTVINGGTLAVNGSIASNVTVGAGGTLGGNGTIFGA